MPSYSAPKNNFPEPLGQLVVRTTLLPTRTVALATEYVLYPGLIFLKMLLRPPCRCVTLVLLRREPLAESRKAFAWSFSKLDNRTAPQKGTRVQFGSQSGVMPVTVDAGQATIGPRNIDVGAMAPTLRRLRCGV